MEKEDFIRKQKSTKRGKNLKTLDFIEKIILLNYFHQNNLTSRYTVFTTGIWNLNPYHASYNNSNRILWDGACSAMLFMGLEDILAAEVYKHFLISNPLTQRSETTYIFIYKEPQPHIFMVPPPFYRSPAAIFFLVTNTQEDGTINLHANDFYIYCAFCMPLAVTVTNYQFFPPPDLTSYWNLDIISVFVRDDSSIIVKGMVDELEQTSTCASSPWAVEPDDVGKFKTQFMAQHCPTRMVLVQTVAAYFNFTKSLYYDAWQALNIQLGGTIMIHDEEFGVIPGNIFVSMGSMDIFYCAEEYMVKNSLSKVMDWVAPFDYWIWVLITATLVLSGILITVKYDSINICKLIRDKYFSNLTSLAREFLRQPAPDEKHVVTTMVAVVAFFLLLSYENYITCSLVAPMRRALLHSLRQLVDHGFQLNYPSNELFGANLEDVLGSIDDLSEAEEESTNVRNNKSHLHDEYLAQFCKNFAKELSNLGLENCLQDQMMFQPDIKKMLSQVIAGGKFAIIDLSRRGEFRFVMETALLEKKCYTVDTLSISPEFDKYSIQGQEKVGRLSSYLAVSGISWFWDGLYKSKYILLDIAKELKTVENLDSGMIILKDLELFLLVSVAMLSMTIVVFLMECHDAIGRFCKKMFQKLRHYVLTL